ncbi:MAG: signal peptidase I [Cyanobacteria bacterium SBLK]|nr:signal peptidase I [Cyanobacteria bacterium SBLK]
MTSPEKKLDVKDESTPSKSANWRGMLWENLQVVAIALILVLIIRTFIAEPRYIPSDSMYPTLKVGDRVVVEKLSHYFRPIQRGDIIVFRPPFFLQKQGYTSNQAFIKRAIATSGEKVEIYDGRVYIDDTPLTEDYIAENPNYRLLPARVPDRALFMMGDNRNNSNDSHIWGFLPEENEIGRAIFRFWPPARIGLL